ncbi:MAG: hypothetical protein J5760_02435 [Clostridia bacterium]|nr:hypothetical protein [Clostridia bacterium]
MKKFGIYIQTESDIIDAVNEYGFVPLFANSIPGFSIEENVSPDAWYSSGSSEWKVWEWKGPVINECGCAYGKFFENKAVFVSREWFLDLANYRRDGYDFDARFDDGLAPLKDKELFDVAERNAPVLSKQLKALGEYGKGGKSGFDQIIAKLQKQCYLIISDFVYERDSKGNPYGWGVAEYSTPEQFFGEYFTQNVYKRKPEESYARLTDHLRSILPQASDRDIAKLLK